VKSAHIGMADERFQPCDHVLEWLGGSYAKPLHDDLSRRHLISNSFKFMCAVFLIVACAPVLSWSSPKDESERTSLSLVSYLDLAFSEACSIKPATSLG
jgi:hypothetical protein